MGIAMKITVNLTLITIIFIILKLTGLIDWSWFYVFVPTIIDISILVSIFIFGTIMFLWGKDRG